MTMSGAFKTTEKLNEHLALSDSSITRQFPLIVKAAAGQPITNFQAEIMRANDHVTDLAGQNGDTFSVNFTPDNYKQPLLLKVTADDKTAKAVFDLFSTTPLIINFQPPPPVKIIKAVKKVAVKIIKKKRMKKIKILKK